MLKGISKSFVRIVGSSSEFHDGIRIFDARRA